ncbi:L,D-transpeptidase family protein [Roseovarius sp. 2305UL8-3]|uniref:L,D-transpeptidase family protein n=1 Tax=Roseovarius conchicola TaxID=3121636 RepID=UPI003528D3B4
MIALAIVVLVYIVTTAPVAAQVTAFKQAVAEAASDDRDLAGYYRDNAYASLWTGQTPEDQARRKALFAAIAGAKAHGLPTDRYDPEGLMEQLKAVRSARDLGFAEVAMSKTFLRLASDLQTGVLKPANVVPGNKRAVVERDPTTYLSEVKYADPRRFFRSLAPQTNEYARLMKEKARLEHLIAQGGWGKTVSAKSLEPGQTGPAVLALRDRLVAMGYLTRNASGRYDAALQNAVQTFQENHGLEEDGTAGAGTMTEINTSAEERLKSVMVALERERWFNRERGTRHILVNLTDFTARIIKDDRQVFTTRSVVGKNVGDRRTPEFSDEMEFMVINPTWHVPRSITVKEYLPMMKKNRNAAGHLKLYDRRGRAVSRGAINFGAYNARNFPYSIKQPPSSRNALGLVKFMFPNKYNIYLHDTPSKNLFLRETRAYSHGCIRLQQPFEFAYALLADQSDDPEGLFHSKLRTGSETKVMLERPIPVHIIYRTAFTTPQGKAQYRRDVYGRDNVIWNALSKAGVSLAGVQG